MIFLQLSQLGSLLHSIVQRTNGIHQLDGQSVVTQPYTTLGNLLYLLHLQLSAISHTLAEQLIATIDILLQQSSLVCVQGARHSSEGRVLVGLYLAELHTQLLGQQLTDVWEHTEDTNGTRQCGGLCVDVVGITADVVTTRGSIVTHRNHYGLLGFQVGHCAPYLLGSIGRTTRRVHAQHHSLHVVIVHQLLQVLANRIGHNVVVCVCHAARL